MRRGRRPNPVPAWLAAAVCHGLNPQLSGGEGGTLHLHGEGGAVALGRHTEGLKFYARLSCGLHFHFCTLHSVTHARKLLCRLCEPPQVLKGAHVVAFTRPEVHMHQTLASLGLAGGFEPQVKLPFWPGLVDFYSPALHLVVQVDGPRHFYAEAGVCDERRRQASVDAHMLASAWRAGAATLRARDYDLETPAAAAALDFAVQTKRCAPHLPFIALTPGFAPGGGPPPKGDRDPQAFIDLVLSLVMTDADSCTVTRSPQGITYIAPTCHAGSV